MAPDSGHQSILNKARRNKFLLVLTLPPVLKDKNQPLESDRVESLVKLDSLQFSVFGAPVPSVSIPAINMPVMGQPYHVTSQKRDAYPPITVNFTIDNQFNNYYVLWKWLSILNNPKDSGMDSHFNQYQDGVNDLRSNVNTAESLRKRAALTPIANNLNKILANENKDVPNTNKISKDPIHMKNEFTDYQTLISVFGLDEYNNNVIRFDYSNAFITNLGEINYNYRDPEEATSSFQFVFNQLDVELLDVCD